LPIGQMQDCHLPDCYLPGAIRLAQQVPTETSSQLGCEPNQSPTFMTDDLKLKAFTSR
jgi:hypothetical protein